MKGTRANLPSHVSRETWERLKVIVRQVEKWQPRINLIASATLGSIWERHVEDSLQLAALAPEASRWLDLGSGGGFPGLVVAAARADRSDFRMVLVESSGKKCAFLRETARLAGLSVTVENRRIEDFALSMPAPFDVVSARALAPLPLLLSLAEPFLRSGAVGLFPKGQDVDDELEATREAWHLESDLIQSQTEPGAAILRVRSATRRQATNGANR